MNEKSNLKTFPHINVIPKISQNIVNISIILSIRSLISIQQFESRTNARLHGCKFPFITPPNATDKGGKGIIA